MVPFQSRRKFLKAGLLLGAAAILDAFWFERFFIETNEYDLGKTTSNSTSIKAVQISDLHLNSIQWQHRRLANKLNALQPDLLFLTGDSVDKARNVGLLDEFLSLINRKIKKIAIPGNWEYWGNIDFKELKRVYDNHNCDLLINETRKYSFGNKSISVTGVDDYVGGNADIKLALEDYQESSCHIVLNHCPEYCDQIIAGLSKGIKIDLILAGHTHGGQINILGLIPFLPQGSGKYVKGWYKNEIADMYVSKGIGTSVLPIRFAARAEVAIFNI